MSALRTGKRAAGFAALVLGAMVALCGCGDGTADQRTSKRDALVAADDTAKNVRDRRATVTPTDQSDAAPDRELTQRIRQALMTDDGLSMSAKNVKVITITGGPVTLRGPVGSKAEKTTVVAKARRIAGNRPVVDELEVAAD